MAKYYYNGVLLPEIPADVLAQHPYCLIRENKTTGYYDLNFANGVWYLRNDSAIAPSISTNYPYYRLPIETAADYEEWEFYQTTSNAFTVDESRPVLWSNHDIPNGSATATEIYFYGSEPVAEDYVPPKTYYRISGERLTGYADQARRLGGVTGELTPAQIEEKLADVNPVTFVTSAVGVLPVVVRGTASSEFSLTFETSATGAVQEG